MIAYVIEVLGARSYVERNAFATEVTFTPDIQRARRFLRFEDAAHFHAATPAIAKRTIAVVPIFSTAAMPCRGCD